MSDLMCTRHRISRTYQGVILSTCTLPHYVKDVGGLDAVLSSVAGLDDPLVQTRGCDAHAVIECVSRPVRMVTVS